MCSYRILAVFCTAVLIPIGMCAGSPASATRRLQRKPPETYSQFRVDSNLVLVNVAVRDSRNRSVVDLGGSTFRVFDDKLEQPIAFFTRDDAPVSVGIVFDASGSMSGSVGKSREAVRRFCESAADGDEFFVVLVQDRAEKRGDFTTDCDGIAGELLSVPARGHTALLDGIYLGVEQLQHASNARKALLVISDGADNASRYRERDIRRLVEESDVQIFSIEMNADFAQHEPALEMIASSGILEEISGFTGGAWARIPSQKSLAEVAARAGVELHNQYLIGYRPPPTRDGRYHRLRVTVLPQAGGRPLRVSYRPGYYAPAR